MCIAVLLDKQYADDLSPPTSSESTLVHLVGRLCINQLTHHQHLPPRPCKHKSHGKNSTKLQAECTTCNMAQHQPSSPWKSEPLVEVCDNASIICLYGPPHQRPCPAPNASFLGAPEVKIVFHLKYPPIPVSFRWDNSSRVAGCVKWWKAMRVTRGLFSHPPDPMELCRQSGTSADGGNSASPFHNAPPNKSCAGLLVGWRWGHGLWDGDHLMQGVGRDGVYRAGGMGWSARK